MTLSPIHKSEPTICPHPVQVQWRRGVKRDTCAKNHEIGIFAGANE